MYAIYMKLDEDGKFMPIDYEEGIQVKKAEATTWKDREYVVELVEFMKEHNPTIQFEVRKV